MPLEMTKQRPNRVSQDEKHELRRYWDTHPISTDSVPYEVGTHESFEAIYEKWK